MTLKLLFSEVGLTSAQVAAALKTTFGAVDPTLFDRIDEARQGLPMEMVSAIANVLGIRRADVEAAATRLTLATGETSRVALPPRIGDTFSPVSLAIPVPTENQLVVTPKTILGQQEWAWFRSDIDISVLAGRVTNWTDQSPAGNNLTTSVVTRPTYLTGGVNGLPYVHFSFVEGSSLFFPGAGIAGTSGLDWTFIFAFNGATIARDQALFTETAIGDPAPPPPFALAQETQGVPGDIAYYNGGAWVPQVAATTGMQILAFVFDEINGEARIYRNGSIIATDGYAPHDFATGGQCALGGGSGILASSLSSFDGDLYEMVGFGQPLDTSTPNEWQRLHEEYLFPRYALS